MQYSEYVAWGIEAGALVRDTVGVIKELSAHTGGGRKEERDCLLVAAGGVGEPDGDAR